MTLPSNLMDRRAFLAAAAASTAAAALPALGAVAPKPSRPEICAFIKFIQALSYDEMAARVAAIGFDGIESTVRAKGHVLPERVKDDLPRQLEAVRKQGLDITIMTTDVVRLDDPYTEDVLRTGAALGLKMYRMGFYRYDLQRSVMEQLKEIRPQLQELAAFNKELGLTAVYQNHSGVDYVGAPIWDLHYLLEGIPVEQIGVAYDIRHAMIEGGLSWPLGYDLIKPSLGAVFAKDFQWNEKNTKHVPLGEGRVDKKFFKTHVQTGIACPVSLHVEYVGEGATEENLAALARDYKTLCKWLDQ